MDELDALLADLESSSSQISRTRPLSSTNRDTETPHPPPPPTYTPQQTVNSAKASKQIRDDKERLYSTVCKPKTTDSMPDVVSTMVSSGLSDLDRLLQELNVSQSSLTDEILAEFPMQNVTKSTSNSSLGETGERRGGENAVSHSMSSSKIQPPLKMTASSATRELDKLMASLSEFKLHSAPPPRSHMPLFSGDPACPETQEFSGILPTDRPEPGTPSSAQGNCAACLETIVGQRVLALGKLWHPDHFSCVHCCSTLAGGSFFEKEGRPYCERDFLELFSPRCANCLRPIVDKMVTALGKTWHPDHFCCSICEEVFGPEGFHEKGGKAFCKKDFLQMFASRCQKCSEPIVDEYVSALDVLWHCECFKCWECSAPFTDGSFYEVDGRPFCALHSLRSPLSLPALSPRT